MDKSQKGHKEVPPHLEQKNLIEFLESFHRLFKIGIYYPAGHKVLDQAAEQFQLNISGVADTNRSVHIELQDETLSVEGQKISTPTKALVEFTKLILELGISSIEVDRTILLPELLQLVRSLLLGRSQLQGIKEFTEARIADLPTAVRVVQKEFSIDENAILVDGNGEDAEQGLNTVFQVLAEQGLENNKIEQCRRFLNGLSEKYSTTPLNVKGLPTVTWSDVRGLLVKVISNAFHLSDTPTGIFAQNQLNTLSAIFQGLEKEVKDKESRETINLLISVFSGSSSNKKQLESDTDKSKRIRPADNVPLQSIDQLKTFVIDNFVPRDTLEKIIQIDRCEELSILMQLLQFSQESTVEDRIIQNLRDILTTELNNREIRTLISALMFMASQNDSGRFYETMRFLTILFRSRKKFSSQEFLVTICQKVSPAAQTLVWPILVNEILACGRNDHQTVFNQLVLIAATLSLREMKDRWPELEAMDCFQEKRIASEIFNPQLKNTFHLFSFLLETSLKRQISARILSGILASPPDWLIEAVAPMLQLTIPQHVKFLQIYLLAAHKDYFSINLRVAAGTLVVNHLPDISEQQMNEAWVVKTLEATPELQVEETRPLLELILAEKRMLVLPKWPNACRRAATEALKKLRRKPL